MMEVKVMINETGAKVEFEGIWTRRFVDIAYKNMILQLPMHMAKIKEQDIASKQSVGRKTKGGSK